MDKTRAKLITAERLRREADRAAQAEAKREAERIAYDTGRRRGERDARAEPVKLPLQYTEAILTEMSRCFAAMAVEKIGDGLPYPVVMTVAEEVWKHVRQGVRLRETAEFFVEREAERGNIQVRVYVPAMQSAQVIDRRMLDMVRLG